MKRTAINGINRSVQDAAAQLDLHGEKLFAATHDWQSPLRSGGGPGCKGDHSDPTSATVISPDPLAQAHKLYVRLLVEHQQSAIALADFIRRFTPIDPALVDRGRTNTIAVCVACGGPAIPIRAGKCDACRKAWERAGKPDLTTFRRLRQKEAEAAAVRLHEHEVLSHGTVHSA